MGTVAYLGTIEERETVSEINQKYMKRLTAFQRTGDVKYLDPDDQIFHRMMSGAAMMQGRQGMI